MNNKIIQTVKQLFKGKFIREREEDCLSIHQAGSGGLCKGLTMRILLSLDYELFFGTQTGSAKNCLFHPIDELLKVTNRHGVYLSFFVDALYLHKLADEATRFPSLQRELDQIRRQLTTLKENGHDMQLHLHPHWIDSSFDGYQWKLDTTRYKLHDFSRPDIDGMVAAAKKLLTDLTGDAVFAFRAGGWCLQPFAQIAPILLKHNIWLDSTVFPGGISDDEDRWFDFSDAPIKDHYNFHKDPALEDNRGPFLEVPISPMNVSPLLFWKMGLSRKLLSRPSHTPFGDGSPLAWGKGYYLHRLTKPTISVASIDGMKAGMLNKAFRYDQASGKQIFHIMGHPKALSHYSLNQLDRFLKQLDSFSSITFQYFKDLQPTPEEPMHTSTNTKESNEPQDLDSGR